MELSRDRKLIPVGKIEKAVCRSVFLTIWYCILSAECLGMLQFKIFSAEKNFTEAGKSFLLSKCLIYPKFQLSRIYCTKT